VTTGFAVVYKTTSTGFHFPPTLLRLPVPAPESSSTGFSQIDYEYKDVVFDDIV
jgi:hypothetical protein